MPSTWRIRKRSALLCLLAVFGLGIAAERYRQYWSTNVGDVSVRRTDSQIGLTIDGDVVTNWDLPVTLRAGFHQFQATWQGFQVVSTVDVKRGDPARRNRVKYSLHNGQLQVEHNSRFVDVAPRPAPGVFAIQTATEKFWHTSESGEIVLRSAQDAGGVERFTIHWLRPDHSEAFIQSGDGRFVTNLSNPPNAVPGSFWLADDDDQPSRFKIDRVGDSESWIKLATGEFFVGVDAESKRVRISAYELFASPHLFYDPKGEADVAESVPPPAAITVFEPASSAPSVRRFKGHTNVIRAVVFTPNGQHIISGSSDGTIRFWNVKSGTQVHMIQAHRPVMSLAISSDGKTLASGMIDRVVKTWNLQHDPKITHHNEQVLSRAKEHRGVGPFKHIGHVQTIDFSPDNSKVAAADNSMLVWNLLAPNERCKSSTIVGAVTSLVWSSSGHRVLMCVEGRSLRWWPKSPDSLPRDGRGKVLFRSADRPLVISGENILDPESHQVVYTFQQRQGVRVVSAQISTRRNLLVTADVLYRAKLDEAEPDELVSVWDLQTGRPLAVLQERFGQVGNIAISPSGQYVAYGNGIRDTGFYLQEKSTGDYDLRVWRVINDEPTGEREPE